MRTQVTISTTPLEHDQEQDQEQDQDCSPTESYYARLEREHEELTPPAAKVKKSQTYTLSAFSGFFGRTDCIVCLLSLFLVLPPLLNWTVFTHFCVDEHKVWHGLSLHIFINICCYTFCCIPRNNKFSCLFFLAFPSLVVLLWFVFPWLVLPLFRVRVRVLSCLLFSNRIFKSTSCKRCPSQPNLWPH